MDVHSERNSMCGFFVYQENCMHFHEIVNINQDNRVFTVPLYLIEKRYVLRYNNLPHLLGKILYINDWGKQRRTPDTRGHQPKPDVDTSCMSVWLVIITVLIKWGVVMFS